MNPYTSQPPKAFWKSSVAERNMFDISDLWQPKFKVSPSAPVATYGSCFAQHFGNALRERKFNWLVTEKAPFGLGAKHRLAFNYDLFSSRTGNIYTTTLLRHWCDWALGDVPLPEEIWEDDGRFFDPFRPQIEPFGFETAEEMHASRSTALNSFAQSVTEAEVFVFTLGLTERWIHRDDGYEYPMCPGTAAGTFRKKRVIFDNLGFQETRKGLVDAIEMMRSANPALKVLLTVSPVPLTATATDQHVMVATMYSKSVLRAVAGQVADDLQDVDYFPSYEIINSPAFRGAFFEPNQRNVNATGVNFVMRTFFENQQDPNKPSTNKRNGGKPGDTVCEEELLAAFGGSE